LEGESSPRPPASPVRLQPTRERPSPRSALRRGRELRSWLPRRSQGLLLQDRGCALALLDRRNERKADISLPGLAQIGARRDDDAVPEQPLGARLRALANRDLNPKVHRRLAAGHAPAAPSESPAEDLALAPIDLSRLRHVLFVAPRDDRCTLHELLGRRPDCRTIGPERVDHPRWPRDESRAETGHRRALAQGVENDHAGALRLERGDRRLPEPELAE